MVAIGAILFGIFSSIGAAVVAAGIAVAAAISAALAAITAAMVWVSSVVVGVVTGVLTGVGLISGLTAANFLTTVGLLNVTSVMTFAYVASFVASLTAMFSTFLTAIHFQTLKQIHDIAYILSVEYRGMMNRVYAQISKVSADLGLGPYTLMLIIENTRSVVASASAFMGRNFDLFEVSWLKQFHGAMEKMNLKMNSYRQNPGELIYDMDVWITKPTIDSASRFNLIILSTVEKITEGLEELTNRAMSIRSDLEQFVHDLPQELREEIEPRFKELSKYMDDFIHNKYAPKMALLNQSMSVLKTRQDKSKADISSVVDRLLRPGDYLHEIDAMEETTRLEQENKVAELATRPSRRAGDALSDYNAPAWAMLLKLQAALGLKLEPVGWHVAEKIDPGRPAMAEVAPRLTWFVGDY